MERNDEILKLRKEGWKFVDIAKRFGISKQRVHQIFNTITNRNSSSAVYKEISKRIMEYDRDLTQEDMVEVLEGVAKYFGFTVEKVEALRRKQEAIEMMGISLDRYYGSGKKEEERRYASPEAYF